MKNLSDEALMEQVANGNLDMMHDLFKRYNKRIYNFSLLMIKDEELSRDITQEIHDTSESRTCTTIARSHTVLM